MCIYAPYTTEYLVILPISLPKILDTIHRTYILLANPSFSLSLSLSLSLYIYIYIYVRVYVFVCVFMVQNWLSHYNCIGLGVELQNLLLFCIRYEF